jgi:ribosomal protein S27AE
MVNAMGVATVGAPSQPEPAQPALPKSQEHYQAHYLWAVLIARIYEVFPLVCPICGGQMRIIAFIIHSADIRQILEHIGVGADQRVPWRQRFCQRCGAGLRLAMPKDAQTEKSRATGPEQALRQAQPEGL